MIALRSPVLCAAIGLGALLGCSGADAADPWPEPRPIARETPAFQAPAEPPRKEAAREPVATEPEGPLVLQDALALALMRSPELAVFSWEVRAGEARALQARKTSNPELDVRIYDLGIERQGMRQDEARSRVVLGKVFELGGKRRRRAELANAEAGLAGWDYEAKRIEVAGTVAGHFASVLGGQRRVASLERFVARLDELTEEVAARVETGGMRSLELHQIKRQAGLARIDLRRAEADLSVARFRLAATWGAELPRFTEAVGDLEESTSIPDIATVIGLARESPAIARWDAELARSEAALALAKAGRVPDLNYGVGMRWEDDASGRDYLVDLEIDLPIFDRKQGDVREARFDMARARAGREAAQAASSEAIAELYYALTESAERRRTLGEEVLPAAQATYEALRVGFENQADYLGDLLDARRDLARAEVQYTDALVDYHRALAALEGFAGRSLAGDD